MRISKRISALAGSPTLALDAKVQSLRSRGVDVVDFGAGQPDFATSDAVKQAAYEAIRENRTRYTHSSGLLEARQAVAHHLDGLFGLAYDPAREVMVTNGAKQALYNAVHSLVDPGDEVIVLSPYWVSYPDQIRSAGGVPVVLPTEEAGFAIDTDRLARLVSDRTRAIVVNSPSNPTGRLLAREELEAVARLAVDRDLFVISDEIYGCMVYEGKHVSFPSVLDAVRARTILVGAVSKTYSMTGWRIGWAAGPEDIIAAMGRLQSHCTSNPCTVSQWAAIEALRGDQSERESRLREFARRRARMVQRLNDAGMECAEPAGAFFCFPRVDRCFGGELDGKTIDGSLAFADACLDAGRVAVVPGIAFGTDAFVRISYAVSIEEIDRGMDRLAEFLTRIRQPA